MCNVVFCSRSPDCFTHDERSKICSTHGWVGGNKEWLLKLWSATWRRSSRADRKDRTRARKSTLVNQGSNDVPAFWSVELLSARQAVRAIWSELRTLSGWLTSGWYRVGPASSLVSAKLFFFGFTWLCKVTPLIVVFGFTWLFKVTPLIVVFGFTWLCKVTPLIAVFFWFYMTL
jgi:hypothetical protein